jgi:hypothetical protein
MDTSFDKDGTLVVIGDTIEILNIDERLYKWLDHEDKQSLLNFVGDKLQVTKINSDGSLLVTKFKKYGDIIDGHDVAIFPDGARRVNT